ncbi:uncharacterized protein BO66DRAFT_49617 [Aspergillus aculeatinus CBS 121060]|uniref:Uncharacterized protein n=1 Tax=Aspergillus aculeatinus CBS 121060 TaxID=1448322 RepID=A0ACD1HE36_9EURO|nr:hypothetical protein BO66DRAFT_49617 [Aspergillus aculeatinus CBS 121060]RAH71829.1 hypothetical protein BO66DRAFT_49617 [Aspergillus aculeatinus CBS 121060]
MYRIFRGTNDVAVQSCTHYVMHFVIRYVLVRRDMHLGVLAVRMWEETPMTLLQGQIQQELSKHEPGCCSSGTSYAGTKLSSCSIPLAYEVEEHVENSNVPALHALQYCHGGMKPRHPGTHQITYRAAITPPFWLDRSINPMIETAVSWSEWLKRWMSDILPVEHPLRCLVKGTTTLNK